MPSVGDIKLHCELAGGLQRLRGERSHHAKEAFPQIDRPRGLLCFHEAGDVSAIPRGDFLHERIELDGGDGVVQSQGLLLRRGRHGSLAPESSSDGFVRRLSGWAKVADWHDYRRNGRIKLVSQVGVSCPPAGRLGACEFAKAAFRIAERFSVDAFTAEAHNFGSWYAFRSNFLPQGSHV
jgi:hypothetical protein